MLIIRLVSTNGTCPAGAEATGPCFTPDGKTLFVSVQHPAVVAIRKADGGAVGA